MSTNDEFLQMYGLRARGAVSESQLHKVTQDQDDLE